MSLQKQIAELKRKAAPLKPGERPVPTAVMYLQGEEKTYEGDRVALPDGTPLTDGPVYGRGRLNAAAVLDQGGNIMGPEANLEIMESVRPDSPDAHAAAKSGEINTTNGRRVTPHTDGLFYDHLNVMSGTAAGRDQLFSQPFDVQVKQRLTAYVAGTRTPLLYINNTHRITNRGLTSDIGTSRPWPRN